MAELITVIITCHNLERYIGEAIESVLAQDYDGPVEVLVVDDASSDASASIIRNYPSVIYLPTPANLGVLMATVHGLRHARGDVVSFLDGDDVWRKDKLSLCMERFRRDPQLALITHDLSYIDCNSAPLYRVSRPEQVIGRQANTNEIVRNGILNHSDYVWLGSAYSLRRSLSDIDSFCSWAENLPDPFNTYQDWPLAYWVASRKNINMAYVPEKLFGYRLHEANYSGDARSKEKAIKNLRRSYNTTAAILDIAHTNGLQGKPLSSSLKKKEFYNYLIELYSGNRVMAAFKFITVQPYIFGYTRNPAKEWARWAGVSILGARRFLELTKK